MVRFKVSNKKLLVICAFIAIYFIWGTSYLAISFALKGFMPFTISALRYLAAGIILSAWICYKKTKLPKPKDIKILIISGVLMLTGGSGLVVVGEQYISSGAAAVIVATEPLFFLLLDRSRWTFYFADKRIITGLIIGFVGIVLFTYFAPDNKTEIQSHPIFGAVITILSAISWVIGVLYANKNLSSTNSTMVNSAVQLISGGICSSFIAGLMGEWPHLLLRPIPTIAWIGLIYLVIMGSLLAYLSFNYLVTVQPPAIVSTHTYVNPIIAILMGWMLASENVSVWQLAAVVFVLGGVLITQIFKPK
ncbi:drug/metabolite exporter YedA [Pedobacter ginsengiterrae]|uniref:Drug/metabolite exporter YedA n=1 Tax=Pedobacter ginsengiterrae TaxID=871696 RepID=A0ABP7P2F6_9SPHI